MGAENHLMILRELYPSNGSLTIGLTCKGSLIKLFNFYNLLIILAIGYML